MDTIANDFVFVAEFHKANDEGMIHTKYRIPVKGSPSFRLMSPAETTYEDFRTSTDFQGWFGTIDSIKYDEASDLSDVSVSYNNTRNSWDYDWKSNRWSGPETAHVVTCYLFQKRDSKLLLVQQTSSPRFVLSCTHKHPVPKSIVRVLSQLKTMKKPRLDDSESVAEYNAMAQDMFETVMKEVERESDNELDDENDANSDETDDGTSTEDEERASFSIVDRSCYIFDMKRRLENAGYNLEGDKA